MPGLGINAYQAHQFVKEYQQPSPEHCELLRKSILIYRDKMYQLIVQHLELNISAQLVLKEKMNSFFLKHNEGTAQMLLTIEIFLSLDKDSTEHLNISSSEEKPHRGYFAFLQGRKNTILRTFFKHFMDGSSDDHFKVYFFRFWFDFDISLAGLLYGYRNRLLMASFNSDANSLNQSLVAAHELKLSTSSPHPNMKKITSTVKDLKNNVQSTFISKYNPLAILGSLIGGIEAVLKYSCGILESSSNGYGNIEAVEFIFKALFPSQLINHKTVWDFLKTTPALKESRKFCDVNWRKIYISLIAEIDNLKILSFTSEELKSLIKLFNIEKIDESIYSDFRTLGWNSSQDILHFISISKKMGLDYTRDILILFCKNITTDRLKLFFLARSTVSYSHPSLINFIKDSDIITSWVNLLPTKTDDKTHLSYICENLAINECAGIVHLLSIFGADKSKQLIHESSQHLIKSLTIPHFEFLFAYALYKDTQFLKYVFYLLSIFPPETQSAIGIKCLKSKEQTVLSKIIEEDPEDLLEILAFCLEWLDFDKVVLAEMKAEDEGLFELLMKNLDSAASRSFIKIIKKKLQLNVDMYFSLFMSIFWSTIDAERLDLVKDLLRYVFTLDEHLQYRILIKSKEGFFYQQTSLLYYAIYDGHFGIAKVIVEEIFENKRYFVAMLNSKIKTSSDERDNLFEVLMNIETNDQQMKKLGELIYVILEKIWAVKDDSDKIIPILKMFKKSGLNLFYISKNFPRVFAFILDKLTHSDGFSWYEKADLLYSESEACQTLLASVLDNPQQVKLMLDATKDSKALVERLLMPENKEYHSSSILMSVLETVNQLPAALTSLDYLLHVLDSFNRSNLMKLLKHVDFLDNNIFMMSVKNTEVFKKLILKLHDWLQLKIIVEDDVADLLVKTNNVITQVLESNPMLVPFLSQQAFLKKILKPYPEFKCEIIEDKPSELGMFSKSEVLEEKSLNLSSSSVTTMDVDVRRSPLKRHNENHDLSVNNTDNESEVISESNHKKSKVA